MIVLSSSPCLPRAPCRESGNGSTTLPCEADGITERSAIGGGPALAGPSILRFQNLVETLGEIRQDRGGDRASRGEDGSRRDLPVRKSNDRGIAPIEVHEPTFRNTEPCEPH